MLEELKESLQSWSTVNQGKGGLAHKDVRKAGRSQIMLSFKILAEYKMDWGMESMHEYWKTTLEAIGAVQMKADGCLDYSGGTDDRDTQI